MRRQLLSSLVRFWRYYGASEPIGLESTWSVDDARARLLALNEQGDVLVRFDRQGQLLINATAHTRPIRGTPIIPTLRATLTDAGGRARLNGEIALDAGVKIFLAIFTAMFLFIAGSGKEAFAGATLLGIGVYIGILIFAYALGSRDTRVITQRLSQALDDPAGVA
jgi:hypothetical protein